MLHDEPVAVLEAAGIPHMVVGSFASTAHGEPRTTRDLDERVDPSEVASIVAEAASARNGWKVILARCAPITTQRSAPRVAREASATRDLADRV